MGKVKMPRRKTSTNTNFFDQNTDYGGYNSRVEVMDSVDSPPEKEQKTVRPTGRRRGRGPSKNPCLNRNALMARENRQRKKEYLQKIENKLAHLQTENQDLKLAIQRQGQENQKLKVEVNHLRAVMQNSTTVTKLLKAINDSLDNNNKNNVTTALTERLNINKDNTQREINRVTSCERLISNNPMSCATSCAASSTSNEENSDPLYDQGEALITKLASLVEEDIEDEDCGPAKKSKYQDSSYVWVKDDDLNSISGIVNSNAELADWTDKKMNILPLPTDKSEYMSHDFTVDSLFENLNDSTTESLDQSQMDNAFEDSTCDTTEDLLPSTGICIHVNKNKVSLEYCAECYSRVNDLTDKSSQGSGGQIS